MKTVADNEYYGLNYDEANNFIYWSMKGIWPDMSVAPDFHNDWDKARNLTRPGWKLFSDASKCKALPNDVIEEKIRNQEKALEKGCEKIALITDSAVMSQSIKNKMSRTGIEKIVRQFTSSQKDEAWEWLSSE